MNDLAALVKEASSMAHAEVLHNLQQLLSKDRHGRNLSPVAQNETTALN